MVNWKLAESTDRLFASLIAANPGIKLDYSAMALMFGQGATYDAIEGRFRRYRKLAEELKAEARANGLTDVPRGRNASNSTPGTPRTPRTPRGPRSGVSKPSSASSARSKRDAATLSRSLASPSKRAVSSAKQGQSLMNAIFVDDDSHDDAGVFGVKAESRAADLEIIDTPASISSAASTATTAKVETPENVHSFASVFDAVKLEDGVNQAHSFVEDAAAPAAPSARATVDPVDLPHDVFGLGEFYFANPPAGYDLDDIYGGAA